MDPLFSHKFEAKTHLLREQSITGIAAASPQLAAVHAGVFIAVIPSCRRAGPRPCCPSAVGLISLVSWSSSFPRPPRRCVRRFLSGSAAPR
ncbi:hypothetical protein Scep_025703 [Stephania cephalantha]|uniref:Uncharacterized protein n=1 Tax=Stephania cephalantha TaxID=152367 RepID=A0AAP0EJ71_9MAGN